LLLDEWLSGLNATELLEGIELIRSIAAEGTTIVLVEHLIDAVRELCQTSVVMNVGKVIAAGDTAAVLSHPEVINAYLGDTNDA
jgi:branched-chain amino acid transport system ATP-binding protein